MIGECKISHIGINVLAKRYGSEIWLRSFIVKSYNTDKYSIEFCNTPVLFFWYKYKDWTRGSMAITFKFLTWGSLTVINMNYNYVMLFHFWYYFYG